MEISAGTEASQSVFDASYSADLHWMVPRLDIGQTISAAIDIRVDAAPGDVLTIVAESSVDQLQSPSTETLTYAMDPTASLAVLAYRADDKVLLRWQVPSHRTSNTFHVWGSQTPRWRGAQRVTANAVIYGDGAEGVPSQYEILLEATVIGEASFLFVEENDREGQTIVHGPISLKELPGTTSVLYLPIVRR